MFDVNPHCPWHVFGQQHFCRMPVSHIRDISFVLRFCPPPRHNYALRLIQQAPGQGTGQGPLHPAIAAALPGVGVSAGMAGMMLPGMGASVPGIAGVPAPAPPAATAPATAVPAVVGSPTFCLLVKNMFDPATETDEGWELDIKEEMEEVRALCKRGVGCFQWLLLAVLVSVVAFATALAAVASEVLSSKMND